MLVASEPPLIKLSPVQSTSPMTVYALLKSCITVCCFVANSASTVCLMASEHELAHACPQHD